MSEQIVEGLGIRNCTNLKIYRRPPGNGGLSKELRFDRRLHFIDKGRYKTRMLI
jgi:hypothetical protein